MTLPLDFQFSQASLQDFVDCPRRFQLRWLEGRAWPALETEPALESERRLQQGAAFHRLLHQQALGIAPERLSRSVSDTEIESWWRAYLAQPLPGLPPVRYPEVTLSAPLRGFRVVAKLDLLAVEVERRAVIVDWKTSRKRPARGWMAGRLQTRIYPYLLVRAGVDMNGCQPFQPAQVELIYWFAEFPGEPERFLYDAALFAADEAYLAALIDQVDRLAEGGFHLTSDERRCSYCRYRSLCRRGIEAGTLWEATEDADPYESPDLSFDFEQVAEIAF